MVAKRSQSEAKIQEKDVRGLKYFDQLAPLLERLHEVGCERDAAGNRSLHYDQYCMLILLFFFNPVVKSLPYGQNTQPMLKSSGERAFLILSAGNFGRMSFAPPGKSWKSTPLRNREGESLIDERTLARLRPLRDGNT